MFVCIREDDLGGLSGTIGSREGAGSYWRVTGWFRVVISCSYPLSFEFRFKPRKKHYFFFRKSIPDVYSPVRKFPLSRSQQGYTKISSGVK